MKCQGRSSVETWQCYFTAVVVSDTLDKGSVSGGVTAVSLK